MLRVDEGFVLVGVVFLADCEASQGATFFTEVGDDGAGVDAGDGCNAFASTPGGEGLNGRPVGVLECVVSYDDTGTLDVWRLKVAEQSVLVTDVAWDTVVADQWLGEDEDLTTVRWVGHGLWVADKGGGEDCLAGDAGLGSKGLAVENWSIL